jgi:hypothetical protein
MALVVGPKKSARIVHTIDDDRRADKKQTSASDEGARPKGPLNPQTR